MAAIMQCTSATSCSTSASVRTMSSALPASICTQRKEAHGLLSFDVLLYGEHLSRRKKDSLAGGVQAAATVFQRSS
eukprot:812830-Pelagomonas_calceolata.AAC.2